MSACSGLPIDLELTGALPAKRPAPYEKSDQKQKSTYCQNSPSEHHHDQTNDSTDDSCWYPSKCEGQKAVSERASDPNAEKG